ncbi:substrate-binding domain-containing protein [Acidobacterium sp. S8]|uniref:substrate-binding domain-containing protein n=1 Tax=Acidobacterium sp. S8 TaxID=1641854 RepID=UPI00131CF611|nr:substrate-binding domain-containing protein [Acidobacterium sp. S8]
MNRREFTTAFVSSLLISGCRTAKLKGKRVVAFSNANNAEPYRAAQRSLMQRLVAQHSDMALVVADAQQDNNRQIAQVETFIRQRPDILIVAPNERAALTAVMGDAMDAKIPVICLERDIMQPNYTTYIRADNEEIGRMAGDFIVKSLTHRYGTPKGNIVALRGLLGVEGEIHRDSGACEIFKSYPEIKIVADPVANWNQSEAKDRMTEVLRVEPQVDVVYGHNDPMAIGGYLAARELGRDKGITFVGVDGLGGPSGGIKKVMDGILQATFIYPLCVDKAIEISLRILHEPGFTPDKTYTMKSTMVTPENAPTLYKQAIDPEAL